MKKKMLIIGITMAAAGSEKSFLSFAKSAIDYEKYDVDLLLAKKTGDFLSQVPKEIRILGMGAGGNFFLIDKNNASTILMKDYLLKNPLRIFSFLPYYMAVKTAKDKKERSFAAHRMWLHAMQSMKNLEEEYDVALAFWGDRTMFYMIDKVRAKTKIAWLHFDYHNPPREDAVYLPYFAKCNKIVTVSAQIGESLKKALPAIADKVVTVENIIVKEDIFAKAKEDADFGDDFQGIRIVTVGRICPQKGYDLALPAIARLINEGYDLKWYIIGGGGGEFAEALRAEVEKYHLCERVSFLGISGNPYAFMNRAEIYMQPSRHEGKPIAVEEAKVLGVPILVTNYASAEEQLDGGNLGFITEISEDGIYFGLKKLLDAPDFRQHLRRNLAEFSKNDSNKITIDAIMNQNGQG